MDAAVIIAIVIAAVVVLGALTFLTLARRSDVRGAGALSAETRRRDRAARRATAEAEGRTAEVEPVERPRSAADAEKAGEIARYGQEVEKAPESLPAPFVPPDPEMIGVSRRQFFNRATVTLMSAGIGAFSAAAMVAFLWPTATGGFGSKVNLGKLTDIKAAISTGNGFAYYPEARTWVTAYPADAISKAEAVYDEAIVAGMKQGIVALYQKCPHLGCRVPSCPTSQWFECGCHGSQYNRVGEKKGGPAPRGMDRFAAEFSSSGEVTVDTGNPILGPPIGTNTTGQEAEGPHCVSGAGGH
jgi:cytochrome b6-f complex iron-sulfur subunit